MCSNHSITKASSLCLAYFLGAEQEIGETYQSLIYRFM